MKQGAVEVKAVEVDVLVEGFRVPGDHLFQPLGRLTRQFHRLALQGKAQ